MRLAACLLLVALGLPAQEKVDLAAVHRIRQEALDHSKVMENAFYLTDVYGPRLTGSPGLKAAAEWAVRQFQEWGLANARLETWGPFGKGWTAVRFSAHLKEPQYQPLIGFARPWSPGTNGPVSGTPVLAVLRTDADYAKYKGKLKGKIVLIEEPRTLTPIIRALAHEWTDKELSDMAAPGAAFNPNAGSVFGEPKERPFVDRETARRRRRKLNEFLRNEGVLLVVTAGDRTDGGTVRATSFGAPDDTELPPPTVAITPEHYNRVVRLLEKRIPVTLEFETENKFLEETKDAFNVVAELPGADPAKKSELVMIGAHLDSWTGGTGATDNAAGSAVMMEVMRVLKATGLKPKRTIRIALWTGEEQGLLGSKAYVKAHFANRETMELKPEHGKLAAYFNLDNGSGKIRGVYLQENDMVRPIFDAWLKPFADLGAKTLSIRNTTGTDHLSFDAVGLPGFQFIQDPVEYGTRTHHTNMDVYDRLQSAHLKQAAAVIASFAYAAAMREEPLPRKPLPKPKPDPGLKKNIPFSKVGPVTLNLDAYIPGGDGPFPAVVIVHGGGFTKGDRNTYVPPLFDPIGEAGMAWFSIDYRLAPGAKYPAPVEDVEKALAWVHENAAKYNVDPDRIALVGESAGGHLVSMAGARGKQKIKAVVSFYGPHDLESLTRGRGAVSEGLQAFLGVNDMSDGSMKVLHEASPINYVTASMPPYLLIHGTKDEQVAYEQSPAMCAKMTAAGASCDLYTVEGAPHGIGPWEKNQAFQGYKKYMVDWLKDHLK